MHRWFRAILALTIILTFTTVLAQEVPVKPLSVYGDAIEVRVSPDGNLLATFENSTIHSDEVFPAYLPVRVYDIERGQLLQTLGGETDYPIDVSFSPDGTRLAALYAVGWLHVWNVADGATVARLPIAPSGARLRWMPHSDQIAVATTQPGAIQIWDINTGAMTSYLTQRYDTLLELRDSYSRGVPDNLAAFDVLPDGDAFVVSTYYGNIQIWDISGDIRDLYSQELERPMLPFRFVEVVAGGERLVALDSAEDVVMVFDTATGELLQEIPATDVRTWLMTVSEDGTHAAWPQRGDGETPVVAVLADLTTGATQELPLRLPEEGGWNSPMTTLHFVNGDSRLLVSAPYPNDNAPDSAVYLVPLP